MDNLYNVLINNGALGCVLVYFMYITNTTIKQNTETIQSLKEILIEIKRDK